MQVVGAESTKRLVVVADNSLIVEAIAIGLRNSGAFKLLGHVNARIGSIQAIIEAGADVVLVDDLDGADRVGRAGREDQSRAGSRRGDRAVHLDGLRVARRDLRRRRGRCDLQGDPSRGARNARPGDDRGACRARVQELGCPRAARSGRGGRRSSRRFTSRELEVLQLVAGGRRTARSPRSCG